jgi:hypothetical protein
MRSCWKTPPAWSFLNSSWRISPPSTRKRRSSTSCARPLPEDVGAR